MSTEPTVLQRRYRLDRLLGVGGFARVYLATDLQLNRQVAVKVLNPDLLITAPGHDFRARFKQEAQTVAALDHPNILGIYDYGETDETVYLVMPYVEGGTLHDRLQESGRLTPQQAETYLKQAAAALDYAHRRGLVHRDIKPQNMLLRAEDDRLLLADFGIAKLLREANTAQSRSAIVGTIAYMAPEQFQGKTSSGIDVYALGCILFQLLTGALPYTGTTEQMMYGHMMAPPPSLLGYGPLLAASQPVIERALHKDPAMRYPSAGDLVAAFVAALHNQGPTVGVTSVTVIAAYPQPPTRLAEVQASRSATGPLPATQLHPSGPIAFPDKPAGLISRRALLAGGGALGFVLAALGGGIAALRFASPAARATATPALSGLAVTPTNPPAIRLTPTTLAIAPTSELPTPSVAALRDTPTATQAPVTPTIAPSTATPAPLATSTTASLPPTIQPPPPPTNTLVPPTAPPSPTPTATIVARSAERIQGQRVATLVGHTDKIRAVAWSADGTTLASASFDRTIRFWSATGRAGAVLTGHIDTVSGLAWSPDGSVLASTAWDQTVRLWQRDGKPLRTLSGHTDHVIGVAWAPDGTLLASASDDRTVRLWRPDGSAVARLIGHTGEVTSVAWSPDGTLLASASYDRTIRLWRANGASVATLTGHTDYVRSLAWSPVNALLASASYDKTLRLWNTAGRAVATLNGHTNLATSVAWSSTSDMLVSGSADTTLRLWDSSGQTLGTLTGHTDKVICVGWSPKENLLASGGDDNTVRLWR